MLGKQPGCIYYNLVTKGVCSAVFEVAVEGLPFAGGWGALLPLVFCKTYVDDQTSRRLQATASLACLFVKRTLNIYIRACSQCSGAFFHLKTGHDSHFDPSSANPCQVGTVGWCGQQGLQFWRTFPARFKIFMYGTVNPKYPYSLGLLGVWRP